MDLKTRHLEDLPDELLDRLCGTYACRNRELASSSETHDDDYASLNPLLRMLFEMRTLPPTTHLALRLVSRRLFRIATPYAWETLDIFLRESEAPGEGIRGRNRLAFLDFVSNSPEIARHVRTVRLESHMDQDWDTQGHTPNFVWWGMRESQIETFLRSLPNLTAFHVSNPSAAGMHVTSDALRTVLMHKSLKLFSYNDTQAFNTYLDDLDLSHLEAFAANHFDHSRNVLCQSSLKLKHLLLRGDFTWPPSSSLKSSLHSTSLSWLGTLEELSVSGVLQDIIPLGKKFQEHGAPLSLKELAFHFMPGLRPRFQDVSNLFGAAPLRRLILHDMQHVTPLDLDSLVNAFPLLIDLEIWVDHDRNTSYRRFVGDFLDFASMLGKFQYLEHLGWDNNWTPDLDVYRLSILAQHCRSLKNLRLVSNNETRMLKVIRNDKHELVDVDVLSQPSILTWTTSWDSSTSSYV